MSEFKTTVVLFEANGSADIHEGKLGMAFPLMGLIEANYVALYVATSMADAKAAIAHYGEHGNLKDFIEGSK